jgi:uncharacterized protein YfbU (UPF0304 family)
MQLSLKERLMLANQFKILEALYPNEAETYATYRTAVEDGYEAEYGRIEERFESRLSKEACKEVWDILDMYRALQSAYQQLDDKGDISPQDVVFDGFDGNDKVENSLMGYARYIVDDLGRYDSLQRSASMNSHILRLNHYRAMFKEWEDAGKSWYLTLERMKRILFPERPPQG